MPGVAFDGSVWVTGGQAVGLVVGSLLFTCAGAFAMVNANKRVGERQLNEQFSRPQPRSRPVQRVTQADLAAPRVVRRPAVPEGLEALEPQELKRGSNNGASG